MLWAFEQLFLIFMSSQLLSLIPGTTWLIFLGFAL